MQSVLELARSNLAHMVLVSFTAGMLLVAVAMAAAASLLRRSNNRKARRWAELEERWRLALDEIVAARLNESELHSSLAAGERLVFVDFLYKQLSRDPRPERQALHARLAAPYLHELERRVRKGDVWQRSRALRTLGALFGRAGEGAIRAALDDPAPLVATTAARAYARLQLGDITPLLDRAERYMAWDRRLLRLTLASFGAAAIPELEARYADPTVPVRTRVSCADALIDLVPTDMNGVIARVLEWDDDVEIVTASLRLVRAPIEPELLARVRALCAAENDVVRAQAVGCLARNVPNADELPEIQRAYADPSPWVVLNARRIRPGWAARSVLPKPDAIPAGGA